MPKTDRPGPRSLTWILVGIAVFVAVLATLPVPEVADGPAPGTHEENFAIVDVTLFDGEVFRHGWDVWVEDGRIRQAGLRLDLPEDPFRRLAATAPDGDGTQHETSVQTLADPDEAAGWVGARKAKDSAVAQLVKETDEPLLSPMQRQTLVDRFSGSLTEGARVAMENVRRLRAAGVRLVAGTDAPNSGTGAGISMHGELLAFVAEGPAGVYVFEVDEVEVR